ncbi:hypothetical protein ACFLX0_01060 [Chloroflexota bacterium]
MKRAHEMANITMLAQWAIMCVSGLKCDVDRACQKVELKPSQKPLPLFTEVRIPLGQGWYYTIDRAFKLSFVLSTRYQWF